MKLALYFYDLTGHKSSSTIMYVSVQQQLEKMMFVIYC